MGHRAGDDVAWHLAADVVSTPGAVDLGLVLPQLPVRRLVMLLGQRGTSMVANPPEDMPRVTPYLHRDYFSYPCADDAGGT